MKKLITGTALAALALIWSAPAPALAASAQAHITRSAKQRVAASRHRSNLSFSQIGNDYTDFKNYLQKKYGSGYALEVAYMSQYGAPRGKKTAVPTLG